MWSCVAMYIPHSVIIIVKKNSSVLRGDLYCLVSECPQKGLLLCYFYRLTNLVMWTPRWRVILLAVVWTKVQNSLSKVLVRIFWALYSLGRDEVVQWRFATTDKSICQPFTPLITLGMIECHVSMHVYLIVQDYTVEPPPNRDTIGTKQRGVLIWSKLGQQFILTGWPRFRVNFWGFTIVLYSVL